MINVQFEFITGVEIGFELLPSMDDDDVKYYFLLNLGILRFVFIKLKPD